MRSLLVLAGFLWCASMAQAQEVDRWLALSIGGTVRIDLDTTTIVRLEGNQFRAWIKMRYEKPQTLRYNGKVFQSSVSQGEFHCKSRQSRKRSVTLYDADGTTTVESYNNKLARWEEVVPGSIGEDELLGVCAYLETGKPANKGARQLYDLGVWIRQLPEADRLRLGQAVDSVRQEVDRQEVERLADSIMQVRRWHNASER